MSVKNNESLIRGFVFTCTDKTEKECFDRSLIGTTKVNGPVVIRVRKDDLMFLHNLDSDVLYGVFNLRKEAWKGRYPYQVEFKILRKNKYKKRKETPGKV